MLFLPRKLAWVFKSKEEKYEKRGHMNTLFMKNLLNAAFVKRNLVV